jgi:hypothetical protein
MLRSLYVGLLRLHPPAFRRHFGEEMLSIFGQAVGRQAKLRLLGDGLMSLVRQWSLRPEFWHEFTPPAEQPASDGVPSFLTLDPFRPRTAAVVHGLVLTVAVFCLTCFAIRYSWIHLLHVQIPVVEFEGSSSNEPSVNVAETPEEPTVAPIRENTQPGVLRSSSVSTAAENNAPGPSPVPAVQQNRTATSRPAPPGRGTNVGAQVFPPLAAAQHGVIRRAVAPEFNSQRTSGASAGREQLDATAPPAAKAVPAAAVQQTKQETKMDATERRRVIDGAVANLMKYYVDPDMAQKMAAVLKAHEKSGDYETATDGQAFADLLTRQMQDVSHDKYLAMVYSTVSTPENPPAPTAEDTATYRREMERTNCTFEKVQVLPHNIGYVKLNSFPNADICGTRAAAAMAELNGANAIIFDLRDNPGGYSNMVALLATYLFDRPTHLNDFYNRGENTAEQSWTLAPVPGNKLADKPAFVLISHTTFSAAEGFSYDLKMLKRATLVGETTSGRGHMGLGHRIDDYFSIRVPGIKVINPISKTNWEGTGVEPDVKVKAADALAAAVRLAVLRLQQRYSPR